MNVKTTDAEQVIGKAIREISHIATLPEITLKIVELVEDPNSTAQDLHGVIANDPALCSRILKVVNSSFYGLPGQIGSINRAIVLLGLNAVKNIAISASLAKLFKGGQLCPKFSAKDLWAHSITTGAASKMVADQLNFDVPDEAFLAGLMHDIGMMVEMQADRNKLIEVVEKLNVADDGTPMKEMLTIEKEIFGASHNQFGQGLCDKWKFPKSFSAVTGFHHAPLEAPSESRTLVCLIYVADRLAGQVGEKYRMDLPTLDYDPNVLEVLKLDTTKLERIREELDRSLEEVENFMS